MFGEVEEVDHGVTKSNLVNDLEAEAEDEAVDSSSSRTIDSLDLYATPGQMETSERRSRRSFGRDSDEGDPKKHLEHSPSPRKSAAASSSTPTTR